MAYLRTVAATLAAVALVGRVVEATEVELPPCIPEYRPFLYSGCFKDDKNPQLLSMRSNLDTNDMTTEKCIDTCKGNGYRYAGLVYYGVCYCGQTVNGHQVDDSECSFPCSGNSSELCGGNDLGRIYQDPTFLPKEEATVEDYESLGCWTDDSPAGRALTYQQNVDGATLTTEKCLQKCRDGGFPFAGTQYGGECFCGVVIGNDTFAAPASECSMPCNGDSSQTCGGPNRLNLYVADELQSLEPCGYVPPVSSSSSVPPVTTAPPTSTPTSPPTSTSSLCVSTTTVPSKCEYKCGKWCSEPIPEFDSDKTCKEAWAECALQVASCFKHAGWPDSLKCFDFGEWCTGVQSYCKNTKSGWSKGGFCKIRPPKDPKPPTTTTYTTTCAPTQPATTSTQPATTSTKPATTSTKCPIPTPTNICKQPTNKKHGYKPGSPVGGIELPVVTCNDLADEHSRYPFKLYNEPNSRKCNKYPRNACTNACADACKEQYEDCQDVYARSCKDRRRSVFGGTSYFEAHSLNKRTWFWTDSYSQATSKCRDQYHDCLAENRYSTGAGKCPKFGVF